ncbi:type 1 glutamine amidotransferase [Bulleidia sp. zg-1006]|uniref:type 1 glutamine amidotransferase n=1 Tax=Bulleidia sp. zg-1006 TaxID=2806552 RepID=UPI001939AF41|nr:glutamine amidotransferase [Bulleidia sp. zg-1006]QRG86136.1 glutamine amidotransferase [Bulleidia sp. zg-1006]
MKLVLLWMYHDLMDLYGDKGNIETLKYRCAKRNIDLEVRTCSLNQKAEMEDVDIFFMGGGADKEQNLIYQDLLSRKKAIQHLLDKGCQFLLICGGYQLFGQYYKDQDGKVVNGLSFFPYYTVASDRGHRCIGDVAIEVNLGKEVVQVLGFENHGGQTKQVETPFGRVLSGHGNEYKGSSEGFMNEQVIATYIHGPLLPKNPEVADFVLQRALARKGMTMALKSLDDEWENKAKEVMLKRMGLAR